MNKPTENETKVWDDPDIDMGKGNQTFAKITEEAKTIGYGDSKEKFKALKEKFDSLARV